MQEREHRQVDEACEATTTMGEGCGQNRHRERSSVLRDDEEEEEEEDDNLSR